MDRPIILMRVWDVAWLICLSAFAFNGTDHGAAWVLLLIGLLDWVLDRRKEKKDEEEVEEAPVDSQK